MKFSKYISKAVTPVMALFQKQHSCLSNKATTICGYSVCSLRQVPVRHNRGGKSTENKVRLAPPTMCRLTISPFFSTSRLYILRIFHNLQVNFPIIEENLLPWNQVWDRNIRQLDPGRHPLSRCPVLHRRTFTVFLFIGRFR